MSQSRNIEIAKNNFEYLKNNNICIPITIKCDYNKSIPDTYDNASNKTTIIALECMRTDDCARYYILNNISKNIAIMNFANRIITGGCYLQGAPAQEEALCRSIPQLYTSLKQITYPFNVDTVLFTPNVRIIRDGEQLVILPEKERVYVSVVSAAAPDLNRESYNEFRVNKTLKNLFYSVKKNDSNIDTLVLGAWGCGAFLNDPIKMAHIMKNICQKYNGMFDRIIFAIPCGPNYEAFNKILFNK